MENSSASRERHLFSVYYGDLNTLQAVNYDLRRELERLRKENGAVKGKFAQQSHQLKAAKTENQNLKQRVLAESAFAAENDQVQRDLEKEIREKRNKLKEKSAKIERLLKELKNERDECHVRTCELINTQKRLEDISSQLQVAEQKISEGKNEIRECHIAISDQMQRGKNQEDEIRSLHSQVQRLLNKIDSKQDVCLGQIERIKELESKVEVLGRAVEENKTLQKQCDETALKVATLENQLQSAIEIRTELEETIAQNQVATEKMEGDYRNEISRLEALITEKQEEIGDEVGETETMLAFVEEVKYSPVVFEDDILPVDHFVDVETTDQTKFELEEGGSSSAIPSSNTLPPESLFNSDPSFTPSDAYHEPPPLSSSPSHEENSVNEDDLYNELISNVMTTLPPHQNLPKPTPKAKSRKRHGENVGQRQEGSYYCFCGSVFQTELLIAAHLKQVQEGKFKCQICPKTFQGFGYFKNHMTKAHSVFYELFACGCRFCGSVFETKQKLKQHCCPNLVNTLSSTDDSNDEVFIGPSPLGSSSSHNHVTSEPAPFHLETMETEELNVDHTRIIPSANYGISSWSSFENEGNGDNIISENSFTTELNQHAKPHGVDRSRPFENLCLCGSSFTNLEVLRTHIDMRT